MKITVPITLALRFLGIGSGSQESNARKSLYGAIVGIGISLVPLIVVLVLADGMIEGSSRRIIELSSAHLRVSDYYGASGVSENPEALTDLAARLPRDDPGGEIVGAIAERQGLGIVIGKGARMGGTVRAVEPRFFTENPEVTGLLKVVAGRASLDSADGAILGKKIASDLGLSVGDTFRILTMRGAGDTSIPRFTTFRVSGIVSSGYQELDALWVFIPYSTGARILSPQASWSFVSVRVQDPFGNIEPERNALMRSLPEGYTVYTWQELNRAQFQSFTTTRMLLLFIMFLIVLVASVNVSSALVMLVMERRREIAILKSTGARPVDIAFAFLLSGFLTGAGGVLLGVPAGILCALNINGIFAFMERAINGVGAAIYYAFASTSSNAQAPVGIHLLDPAYYLETIPIRIEPGKLFAIAAGTLVLSVIVSAIPAYRAGREKPIDTMRKI
ncbi:MAG TPA: FtsX-like permease family protein [Treponemataceae bacterium]|nr:FtsX-like permease family protein [Treponemataceae bacterium]HPS43883.1 FtsX-like permease family protein [Treponemataceae bacterium]